MRQKALQFFIRLNLALLVFARFSQIPADLKLEEEWSVTPSIKEDDFEEHFFNSFHQSKHQFAPVEEFENPKLDNDSNLELTEWTPVEESELHPSSFPKSQSQEPSIQTKSARSVGKGPSYSTSSNKEISQEKNSAGLVVETTSDQTDKNETIHASKIIAQTSTPPATQTPTQDATTPAQPSEALTTPQPIQNFVQPTQVAQPTTPQVNEEQAAETLPRVGEKPKTILINFNNVSIIEYIRFISRITNKNFLFDENDLQFTVTIISEEPTTLDNVMTALLQELRIHDLSLLEEGNNLIIHRNPKVGGLAEVVSEEGTPPLNVELITQVFRLNTVEAEKAASLLRPLLSETALIEVLPETNHLIVTDLVANIQQISRLLKSVDSPQSGLVIGQYVIRNAFIDNLIDLGQRIMQPISQNQTLIFVPHTAANSVFIISSPYLVERTISILQYLDQNQGTTRILNPKELKFEQFQPAKEGVGAVGGKPEWNLDRSGNWQFQLPPGIQSDIPPTGRWLVDPQGNWYFVPGSEEGGLKGPAGRWIKENGNWVFKLAEGQTISPQRLGRAPKISAELPIGSIERTQFYIHKLRYRKGDQISRALVRVAESLQTSGTTNADLISAINSVQWIESSNSLIFTGTPDSLDKARELLDEIDVPLRQVFLEMLILETTTDDALNFSVNPGARFGGGLASGAEAFISGASSLPGGLDTAQLPLRPDASGLARIQGFSLGVIGQHVTHNGRDFATLGALVRAISTISSIKVVLNPKILTEDNSPAEIFVGSNTPFPTQSIANNLGTIITQNFEFRDVGTRLKVTPLIASYDYITLEIEEEVSTIVSQVSSASTLTTQVVSPTTSTSRTTTKVHLPNGFFLVLSGHIRDEIHRTTTMMPCLGWIPFLGGAFKDKTVEDIKRNLLIFIRPQIVDTQEEIDNVTKHNQDIYRVKNRRVKTWKYNTMEALDYLNLEDV